MRFSCNHFGVGYVEFPAFACISNHYKHLHVTIMLSNGGICVGLISLEISPSHIQDIFCCLYYSRSVFGFALHSRSELYNHQPFSIA